LGVGCYASCSNASNALCNGGNFLRAICLVDISLEGKLLSGAFVAAAIASLTGSAWLGLGGAICASVLMSLLHGFACITHKGDQVVSGVAINFLASGLTVILGIAIFKRGGQTPTLSSDERFRPIELWFVDILDNLPILGSVYRELVSGHSLLVYIALICVPVASFILYRTRFGLRLRAVGESPIAVDSAGVSVTWLRYRALIVGGVFCGIAGAYLSISHGANFVREMSAGKGYIALAAVIFGNWRPISAFWACLMFGFLDAITSRLQGVDLPIIGEIPSQLMVALPYIMTIILLSGFIGRPSPPSAIGLPYRK
jgi:ABC-type uncharacterized transport system permease subunit